MSEFITAYLNLLIFQYQDKPKIKGELNAILSQLENTYDFLNTFEDEFDLDKARGKQLDIIGRIVGLSRTVPLAVQKKYFGFVNKNIKAFGFGQAPFLNGNEESYTDLQLNDTDYKFFLKAKIAKNFAKSDIISINEIIDYLFGSKAYVTDGLDMSLTLYIDESIDDSLVRNIQQLDLLPKPQGVRYNNIRQYKDGQTFGFKNKNLNSKGFGQGKFAKGII